MVSSTPSATCAVHPDRISRLTCTRCGSFACAECVSATPEFCVRCAASGGVPWGRLRAVAQAQRFVIQMFLLGVVGLPTAAVLTSLLGDGEAARYASVGVFIVLRSTMAWSVFQLSDKLGSDRPGLWAIGAFIPNIIGLIVLLVISGRATTFLQRAGVKVGLMGASLGDAPPPPKPG